MRAHAQYIFSWSRIQKPHASRAHLRHRVCLCSAAMHCGDCAQEHGEGYRRTCTRVQYSDQL